MELQSKELRVGNITTLGVVSLIDQDVFRVVDSEGDSFKNTWAEIKPIPLTEEWLLKFGFTKHGQYSYFYKDDLIIDKNDLGVFFMCDIDIHVEIKSVHQLQNLYWCLFGEELTLNP